MAPCLAAGKYLVITHLKPLLKLSRFGGGQGSKRKILLIASEKENADRFTLPKEKRFTHPRNYRANTARKRARLRGCSVTNRPGCPAPLPRARGKRKAQSRRRHPCSGAGSPRVPPCSRETPFYPTPRRELPPEPKRLREAHRAAASDAEPARSGEEAPRARSVGQAVSGGVPAPQPTGVRWRRPPAPGKRRRRRTQPGHGARSIPSDPAEAPRHR